MPTVVITPPSAVVTAAEAKASGVFSSDDDNTYVDLLLAVAQGQIDGPPGWLGRAIGTQTLEWRGDDFGCEDIRLLYPPVVSITSVKYDDSDGVEQTVAGGDYRLVGQPSMPRVALAYGESWPSVRWQSEAVRIRYSAGYTTVPTPIKHAIILMAGELRGAIPNEGGALKRKTVDGVGSREYTVPDTAVDAMKSAATALLAPYRVFA